MDRVEPQRHARLVVEFFRNRLDAFVHLVPVLELVGPAAARLFTRWRELGGRVVLKRVVAKRIQRTVLRPLPPVHEMAQCARAPQLDTRRRLGPPVLLVAQQPLGWFIGCHGDELLILLCCIKAGDANALHHPSLLWR